MVETICFLVVYNSKEKCLYSCYLEVSQKQFYNIIISFIRIEIEKLVKFTSYPVYLFHEAQRCFISTFFFL